MHAHGRVTTLKCCRWHRLAHPKHREGESTLLCVDGTWNACFECCNVESGLQVAGETSASQASLLKQLSELEQGMQVCQTESQETTYGYCQRFHHPQNLAMLQPSSVLKVLYLARSLWLTWTSCSQCSSACKVYSTD